MKQKATRKGAGRPRSKDIAILMDEHLDKIFDKKRIYCVAQMGFDVYCYYRGRGIKVELAKCKYWIERIVEGRYVKKPFAPVTDAFIVEGLLHGGRVGSKGYTHRKLYRYIGGAK